MREHQKHELSRPAALCSILVLLLCVSASPAGAQSADALCTVSVLNQTAYVQADGTWLIPNVPTNMGPVRARVTCIEDGETVSGESELFTITTDRQNSIPVIPLGATTPAPQRLDLEAPRSTLTSAGDAVQLSATAQLADGTSRNVTSAAAGVVYVSTDPEVATVSTDGLAEARASGRVLITALYDGTIDTLPLEVITSADSDGDGLSDDFEVRNGLDPNDPVDALEDPDRDGLITRDELDLGTDPQNADSDGDGLADGEEINEVGTNPALFDTDGDGLSDGLELETGSDPLDPASFNLAAALAAFEVTPARLNLVANASPGPRASSR